jgi:zinc protease
MNVEPRVLPMPRGGVPPRPRVPAAERFTLSSGLGVVAVPHGTLPQVCLKLMMPTGAAADPAEMRGLAAITAALLPEGTERSTAEAINARLDALGASLSVNASHDFTQVEMLLLAETLDESLDVLGEVLCCPTFPAHEMERHCAEMIDALEARLDEPANIADDHVSAALFGSGHPYGHLSSGTIEGVRSLTRDAVSDFHARYLRPGGATLVVAGAFEIGALERAAERYLHSWTGMSGTHPRAVVPAAPAPRRIDVPWKGATQAEIRVASLGLARTSPDWIQASVANYLLGGSTITGRLGMNLREEKGWTYGVRSGFSAGVQPAGWVVDTAVESEVAEAAVEEILREIVAVVEGAVTSAELERAKEAMILSLPRAFETPARVISRFATAEAFGLGDRYWKEFPTRVESVGLDDVRRIAVEHFDPSRLVRVVVG